MPYLKDEMVDLDISETHMHPSSDSVKVLIADDDEAMRTLLRAAITQWGYHVIEASNGEEAWEILLQPDAPQLLILDWRMPKLNGLVLCERIRNELDSYPYIIFLTQVSGTKNILKGLEAGADEFLLKPVNFPELRIRLFAGERIVKYLQIIKKQQIQLQDIISYTKSLEELLSIGWRYKK